MISEHPLLQNVGFLCAAPSDKVTLSYVTSRHQFWGSFWFNKDQTPLKSHIGQCALKESGIL